MLDKETTNVSKNVDTPEEGNPHNATSVGSKIQDTAASTDADTLVADTNDYTGDNIADEEIENENLSDLSSCEETSRTGNIDQLLSVVSLCDGPSTSMQTLKESNDSGQVHAATKNADLLRALSPKSIATKPLPTKAAAKEICNNAAFPLVIDADCDQLPHSAGTNNNSNIGNTNSIPRVRRPTISVKCFSPVRGQNQMENDLSPLSPTTSNYDDDDDDTSEQGNEHLKSHDTHYSAPEIQTCSNDRIISLPTPTEMPSIARGGLGISSPNPVEIIDLASTSPEVCRGESPANSSVTAASPSRVTARNMSTGGRRVVCMRHIRRAPKEPEEYVDAMFPHIREAHQRIRQALLHSPLTDVKDSVLLKRKMLEVIQLYTRGCKNECERIGNSVILCRRLKRNIIRLLDLFSEICFSSRQDPFFLYHISQLIAVYSSLEIRLSFNMTRLQKCALIHRLAHVINKHLVVNNESLAKENILRMFLHMPDMYSARFILEPLFNTFLPEILTSSKSRDQKELPDKTFVQYIIILQQWKEMLRDPFEQVELINKAQHFMCPTKTLHSNSMYANHLPIIHTRKNAVKDILNNLKFFHDLRNAAICDDSLQDVDDDIVFVIDEDAGTPAWDFGATYTAEAKYLRHNKNESRRMTSGPIECVDLTEDGCHQESKDEKVDHLTWLTSLKEKACERVTVDESENVICLDSDSDGELFSGSIIDPSESYQDCDAFDTDYTSLDGSTSDDKEASEDETLPTSRITSDGLRTYLAPRSKNQAGSNNEKRMTFTRRPSYLGSPYVRTRDVDGGDGDSATIGSKISATSNVSHHSETPWPLILNTFSVRDQTSKQFSKSSRFDSGLESMNQLPEQNSEDGDEEDDVDDDEEYHSLPSTASSSRTTMGKVIFSQALPENSQKSSRKDDDVYRGLKLASDKLANRDYNEKGRVMLESKIVKEDIAMPLRIDVGDKINRPVKKQVKFNDQPIGPTRRLSMNDMPKFPIKPAIQLNKQHYNNQHCSNQQCFNQHCSIQQSSNQHGCNQQCSNQQCSNQQYCSNQHCTNQHGCNQHFNNQHGCNQHYYNQHSNFSSSPQPPLTSPASSISSATDSLKQMAQQGRRFIDNFKFHSKSASISKCSSATIIDSKCDDIIDVSGNSENSENTITKDHNLTVSTQKIQSKSSPKHGLIDFNKLISKSRENIKTRSLSKQTTTMCRPKDISSTNSIRNKSVNNKHLVDYNFDVDDNVEGNVTLIQCGLGILDSEKSEIEEQNSNVSTTTGPNIDYRNADEHTIVQERPNNNMEMLDIVESTSLEMCSLDNNVGSSDICTSSTTEIILQDIDLDSNGVATKLHDSDDDFKVKKLLRHQSVKTSKSTVFTTGKVLTRNVKRNIKVGSRENILKKTAESVIILENEIMINSESKNANKSSQKLVQRKTGHTSNTKISKETKQTNDAKTECEIKCTTNKTKIFKRQQKKQTDEATKSSIEKNQTHNEGSMASTLNQGSVENTVSEVSTKSQKEYLPINPTISEKAKAHTNETIQDNSSDIIYLTEPLLIKEPEEAAEMHSDLLSATFRHDSSAVLSSETSLTDKPSPADRELNEIGKLVDGTQLTKDLSDSGTPTATPVRESVSGNKVLTRLKLKSKTQDNTSKSEAESEVLEQPILRKNATIADGVELPIVEVEELPNNLGTVVEHKPITSQASVNNNSNSEISEMAKADGSQIPDEATENINQTRPTEIAKYEPKIARENKRLTRSKLKSKPEVNSSKNPPLPDKVELTTVETVEKRNMSAILNKIIEKTNSDKELNKSEKTEDVSQTPKIINKTTKNIKENLRNDSTKSCSSKTTPKQKSVRGNKMQTRLKLKSIPDAIPDKNQTGEEKALLIKSATVVDNVQVSKLEADELVEISNIVKKSINETQLADTPLETSPIAKSEQIPERETKKVSRLKLKSKSETYSCKSQTSSEKLEKPSIPKNVTAWNELDAQVLTNLNIIVEPTSQQSKDSLTAKLEQMSKGENNETAKLKSQPEMTTYEKGTNELENQPCSKTATVSDIAETIESEEVPKILIESVEQPSCSDINLIEQEGIVEIDQTEDNTQVSKLVNKPNKNSKRKRTDETSSSSSILAIVEEKSIREITDLRELKTKTKPKSNPPQNETSVEELENQIFSKNDIVSDKSEERTLKMIEEETNLKKLDRRLNEIVMTTTSKTSKKANKNKKQKQCDDNTSTSTARLEQKLTRESKVVSSLKSKSKPDNDLSKSRTKCDKVETIEAEKVSKRIDDQSFAVPWLETNLAYSPEATDKGLMEIETAKHDKQTLKLVSKPNKISKRRRTDAVSKSSATKVKIEQKPARENKEVSKLKSKSRIESSQSNNKIPLYEAENSTVTSEIEEGAIETAEEEKIIEMASAVACSETGLIDNQITSNAAGLHEIETSEKSNNLPKILNTGSKISKQTLADDISSSSSSTVTNVSKSQGPLEEVEKQSIEGEQLFQLGNAVTFHDIALQVGAFTKPDILIKTTELEPRNGIGNFTNTLHLNAEEGIAKSAWNEGTEKLSETFEGGVQLSEDITASHKSADDNDRLSRRKKEKRKRKKELKEIMCRRYSINDDVYTVYENSSHQMPSTSVSARARSSFPADSLLHLIKAVEAINLTDSYAEKLTEQVFEQDADCNTVSDVDATVPMLEDVPYTDNQYISQCFDGKNDATEGSRQNENDMDLNCQSDVVTETLPETSIIEDTDTTAKGESTRMCFSHDNAPKTNLERLAEAVMLTEAVTQQVLNNELEETSASTISENVDQTCCENPDVRIKAKRVRFSIDNDYSNLETSAEMNVLSADSIPGSSIDYDLNKDLKSSKKDEKNNMKKQTKSKSSTTVKPKTSQTDNTSTNLHSSFGDFINLLEIAKPTKLVEVATQRKSTRTLNLDIKRTTENISEKTELLMNNDSVSSNSIITDKDSNSEKLDNCTIKSPTLASSDSEVETTKKYSLRGAEQWQVINNTSMRATPPETSNVLENADIKKNVPNTLSKRCIKIRLARAKIPKNKGEEKSSDSSTDEAVKNFEFEFGDVTYRPITRKLSAALNHTLQMDTHSSIIDPIEPLYARGRKSKAKSEPEFNVPKKRKRLENKNKTLNCSIDVKPRTANTEKSIRTAVKNRKNATFLETLEEENSNKEDYSVDSKIPTEVKNKKGSFLEANKEGNVSGSKSVLEVNNEENVSFLEDLENDRKNEKCAIETKMSTGVKHTKKASFLELTKKETAHEELRVQAKVKQKNVSFLELAEGEETKHPEGSGISKEVVNELINKKVDFLEAAESAKECSKDVVSFLETPKENFVNSSNAKEQTTENIVEIPDSFQNIVLPETQSENRKLSEKNTEKRSKTEKAKKLASILDAVFLKALRKNSTPNSLSRTIDTEKEASTKKSIAPIDIEKSVTTTDSHTESNTTAVKNYHKTVTEVEAQPNSTVLSKDQPNEHFLTLQSQANHTIQSNEEEAFKTVGDFEVNFDKKIHKYSTLTKDLRNEEKDEIKGNDDVALESISIDEFSFEKTLSDPEESQRNSSELSKTYTNENSNMDKTLIPPESKLVESAIGEEISSEKITSVVTQNNIKEPLSCSPTHTADERASDEEESVENFTVESESGHNAATAPLSSIPPDEVYVKQQHNNLQNPSIQSASESENLNSTQTNIHNNGDTPTHISDFTNLSLKLSNYNNTTVNKHDVESSNNSHSFSLLPSEDIKSKEVTDGLDNFPKNVQDQKRLDKYEDNVANARIEDSKFCYGDISSNSSSCCSCSTTSADASETDLCKNEPTSFKVAQSETQVSELLSNTSASIQDLSLLYLDHEIMSNDALLSELIMDIVSTPALEHNYATKPLEKIMKSMDETLRADKRIKIESISLKDLNFQTKKDLKESQLKNIETTLLNVTNQKKLCSGQDNAHTESTIEEILKPISLKVSIPLSNIKKLEEIIRKESKLTENPPTSEAATNFTEQNLNIGEKLFPYLADIITMEARTTMTNSGITIKEKISENNNFPYNNINTKRLSQEQESSSQRNASPGLLEKKRRKFCDDMEEDTAAHLSDEDNLVTGKRGDNSSLSKTKTDELNANKSDDKELDYCKNVMTKNCAVEELGTPFLHKEFNTQFNNAKELENMGAETTGKKRKPKNRVQADEEGTISFPQKDKLDNIDEMNGTQYQDEAQRIDNAEIEQDIQMEKDENNDCQIQNEKQILYCEYEIAEEKAKSQINQQVQKNEENSFLLQDINELVPQNLNLETVEKRDEDKSFTTQTNEDYQISNEEAAQKCLEQAEETKIVGENSNQEHNDVDSVALNEHEKTKTFTINDTRYEDVSATGNIELPIMNNTSYAESIKDDFQRIKDISFTELQQRNIKGLVKNTNYDEHAGEVTLTNYENEFFVTSCLTDARDTSVIIDDGFKQSKHLFTSKEYSTTNAFKTRNDSLISAQDGKDDSIDFLSISNLPKTSAMSLAAKPATDSTLTTDAESLDKDLLKTNEIIDFTTNTPSADNNSTEQNLNTSSAPSSSTQEELFPNLADMTAATITTPTNNGITKRGFDMPDLDSDFDVVPDTTNRGSIADLKQMNELSYVGVKTIKRVKCPPASIAKFKKRNENTFNTVTLSKPTSSANALRKTGVVPLRDAVSDERPKDIPIPTKQQQTLRSTERQEVAEENWLDSAVSSTTTTLSPISSPLKEQKTTDICTSITNDITEIFSFPEIEPLERPSSSNSIDNKSKQIKLQNCNSNDANVTIDNTTSTSISDNSPTTSSFDIPTSTSTMKDKLASTFQYIASTSKLQLKPTRVSTRARAPARVQIVTPQRKSQDHLKKSLEQQRLPDLTFSNSQARTFSSASEFNSRQISSSLIHPTSKQNVTQHPNLIRFERYIQKLMAFIDVPTIIKSARNLLVDKYALSEAHAAILAQASQYDSDGNEISQPLLLKDHKDGTISILYDNDDCIKLTTNLSKMVKKLSLALSILQEQQSPMLSMRARIKSLLKQLTETAETSMIKTILPPIINSPSNIPTAVVNPTNLAENTTRDIMDLNTLNNVELFNNASVGGGRQQTTVQQQQTYVNNTNTTTDMYTNWNDAEDNNQLMTNISNGDLPLENEDQLMDIDPLPLLADDGGAEHINAITTLFSGYKITKPPPPLVNKIGIPQLNEPTTAATKQKCTHNSRKIMNAPPPPLPPLPPLDTWRNVTNSPQSVCSLKSPPPRAHSTSPESVRSESPVYIPAELAEDRKLRQKCQVLIEQNEHVIEFQRQEAAFINELLEKQREMQRQRALKRQEFQKLAKQKHIEDRRLAAEITEVKRQRDELCKDSVEVRAEQNEQEPQEQQQPQPSPVLKRKRLLVKERKVKLKTKATRRTNTHTNAEEQIGDSTTGKSENVLENELGQADEIKILTDKSMIRRMTVADENLRASSKLEDEPLPTRVLRRRMSVIVTNEGGAVTNEGGVRARVRSSTRKKLSQSPAKAHLENSGNENLNFANEKLNKNDRQTIDYPKNNKAIKTVNSNQLSTSTTEKTDAATPKEIASDATSKTSSYEKSICAPAIVAHRNTLARSSRSLTPTPKAYEGPSSTPENLLTLNKDTSFNFPSPVTSRIGINGASEASTPTRRATIRSRVEVRRSMQDPSINKDFPSSATSWLLNVSPHTLTKTVRVRLKRLQDLNMMDSSLANSSEKENKDKSPRLRSASAIPFIFNEHENHDLRPLGTAPQTMLASIQSNKTDTRDRVEFLKQRLKAQLLEMDEKYGGNVKDVIERVLENTTSIDVSNKLSDATTTTALPTTETRIKKGSRRKASRKQATPTKKPKISENQNLLAEVLEKNLYFSNDTDSEAFNTNNNKKVNSGGALFENASRNNHTQNQITASNVQPNESLHIENTIIETNINSSLLTESKSCDKLQQQAPVVSSVRKEYVNFNIDSSNIIEKKLRSRPKHGAVVTQVVDVTPGRHAKENILSEILLNTAADAAADTTPPLTEVVHSAVSTENSAVETITENICSSITTHKASKAVCNSDNTNSTTTLMESNNLHNLMDQNDQIEISHEMAAAAASLTMMANKFTKLQKSHDNNASHELQNEYNSGGDTLQSVEETMISTKILSDDTVASNIEEVSETPANDIETRAINSPPAAAIGSEADLQQQQEHTNSTPAFENNGFVRLEDGTSCCSSTFEDSSSDCLLSELVKVKKLADSMTPAAKDSTITLLNFDVIPTLPIFSGESRDVSTPAPKPLPTKVGGLFTEQQKLQGSIGTGTHTDSFNRERPLTPKTDASKGQLNQSISTTSTLVYARDAEKSDGKVTPIFTQEEPAKSVRSLTPTPKPTNASATSEYKASSTQEQIETSTNNDISADTSATFFVQHSESDTTHHSQEKLYPLRRRSRKLSDDIPQESVNNMPITKAILKQRRPTIAADSPNLHVHFAPTTIFPHDEENVKTTSSSTTTGTECDSGGGGDGRTPTPSTELTPNKTRRRNQKQKSNSSQSPLTGRKRKSSSVGELNGNFVFGCSRLQAHSADSSDVEHCVVLPASAVVPPVNLANISCAYASNNLSPIKIFVPPPSRGRGRPVGSTNKNSKKQKQVESADKVKAKKTEENLSKANKQRIGKKRANIDSGLQTEHESQTQFSQPQLPALPTKPKASKIKKVSFNVNPSMSPAVVESVECAEPRAAVRKRK